MGERRKETLYVVDHGSADILRPGARTVSIVRLVGAVREPTRTPGCVLVRHPKHPLGNVYQHGGCIGACAYQGDHTVIRSKAIKRARALLDVQIADAEERLRKLTAAVAALQATP